MSSSIQFKRFGRYLILDHLVDGGMAQICRARFLDEQADKIVAIKMIRPEHSQNSSFKEMFMEEIKLTFSLLHSNIVQTYDYGLQDGQLFVAMEYCDGKNLKQFLDKLSKQGHTLPLEVSVYIIAQVCQALHYAHNLRDKLSGQQREIIHRDISPHNIMLNFDGAVKVIDFGIAKSQEGDSEHTQAGTIKGKLSYLAPEYLEGKQLNHLYDQFATGLTLWELLCGRKVFQGSNDLSILKAIQECKIPFPSSLNSRIPRELDAIVLKSLSKNPEERFQNMDLFSRYLMKFLNTNYPNFNASDIAIFAQELFKEEMATDKQKLMEYGKIQLSPYIQDYTNSLGIEKKPGISQNYEVSVDFSSGLRPETARKNILSKPAPAPIIRKKVVEKKEPVKQKSGGGGASAFTSVFFFLILLAGLGWFAGPDELQQKMKEIILGSSVSSHDSASVVSTNAKETKESSKKELPVKRSVASLSQEISIKNFDLNKHVLFVNGVKQIPLMGKITLSALAGEKIYVRVEESKKKAQAFVFIATEEKNTHEVVLVEQPFQEEGYLSFSETCDGVNRFEISFILAENQGHTNISLPNTSSVTIRVPLEKNNLPFELPLKIKKNGTDQLELKAKWNSPEENVDFCQLIK